MNTTHTAYGTSVDVNSLSGVHEMPFDDLPLTALDTDTLNTTHIWYHVHDYDPFNDSRSAVTSYNCGEYLPVLQHNLADIHRTWD